MKFTEKSIVSILALLGSLYSYLYGKSHEKDAVPYVMIGGFLGAWTGELIVLIIRERKKRKRIMRIKKSTPQDSEKKEE